MSESSVNELLDQLVACTDTIARLAVVNGYPDREALAVLDKALKVLEKNGRGEE
jgi:hypothetical protein